MRSETAGRVVNVLVEAGDRVEEGQVLLRLDVGRPASAAQAAKAAKSKRGRKKTAAAAAESASAAAADDAAAVISSITAGDKKEKEGDFLIDAAIYL